MPDYDYLPRRVARQWRRAADAVSGHHEPLRVADRMEKAMAASLRDGAGAHLVQLASAFALSPVMRRRASIEKAVQSLPVKWVRGKGSCFVEAARLLASNAASVEAISTPQVLRLLTEEGLAAMAHQRCFAPMETQLVPSVFETFQEYRSYIQTCLRLARTGHMADQIAKGVPRIRSPRRRTPRKSTTELLHKPI